MKEKQDHGFKEPRNSPTCTMLETKKSKEVSLHYHEVICELVENSFSKERLITGAALMPCMLKPITQFLPLQNRKNAHPVYLMVLL